MTDIPTLPNEIIVKILEYAGPATATSARRSSKLFNNLVEKFGLGKHKCDDLVIKAQNSIFSVTVKRRTADGLLKPLSFEVELSFLDQLFILLTDKLIHSIENLIIIGCVVDDTCLTLLSHLCSLSKQVDSFHNRTCTYHCTDVEFGNFIEEQKFSRVDCSFETDRSTHLVMTKETFKNYMPSTIILLQMNTLLNNEFLNILKTNQPMTFHLEDCLHQITFEGLNRLVKDFDVFPDCSWGFGFISTTPAEPFLEFMETLKVLGFEQTRLNRGHLHCQATKNKFTLSFHIGNLREF